MGTAAALQSFKCDPYSVARSAALSEPIPNPIPDAASKPAADHELTPMETFLDNLFNHHMVLPQPTDEAAPIDGVDSHEPAREDHHGR